MRSGVRYGVPAPWVFWLDSRAMAMVNTAWHRGVLLLMQGLLSAAGRYLPTFWLPV